MAAPWRSGSCGPSQATMSCMKLLLCILLVLSVSADLGVNTVQEWARNLGDKLLRLSESATGIKELKHKYKQKGLFTFVNKADGSLIQEIRDNIHNLILLKLNAVKHVVNETEEVIQKINLKNLEIDENFSYYSTKTCEAEDKQPAYMKKFHCSLNYHFYDECVNTSLSSVHIPDYVNVKVNGVKKIIYWTEKLERTFVNNYENDPSLSWQYFCSTAGILRHYPGLSWESDKQDTFDCRMRPWYLGASMNPKDIIILVENSESMSREKINLAHQVVNNILDTLGSNDFVYIMKVGNNGETIVECFHGLVQATPGNLLEFKHALKYLKRGGIAKFQNALSQAFGLFLEANENGHGALCCNRAILIIAEKMTDTYDDIFRTYNDQESSMRVRVYAYHISEEQEEESYEMKFISCMNQGGYEQIKSPGEVREKVLHYVTGMSRPLVNPQEGHAMTSGKSQFISEEETVFNIVPAFPDVMAQEPPFNSQGHRLMTSVSMPVFDIGKNETVLLGVAGTDIDIEELKKHLLSYKVGVNGYAFIITNNGHLLTHPHLHPEFLGTLKPIHNSVDLTDVEFMDDNDSGNTNLWQLRNSLINGERGEVILRIKYHYDNMRRVSNMLRLYLYTGIRGTPFSVVVALPLPYGTYRATVPEDRVQLLTTRNTVPTRKEIEPILNHIRQFIEDTNWTVHPDWVYCKYYFDTAPKYKSPEDELSHFIDLGGLQCSHNRHFTQSKHRRKTQYGSEQKPCYCDPDLFILLMHDAMETRSWSSRNINDLGKKGVTLAFLATHSGLTRWLSPQDDMERSEFKKHNIRSIDEVWYQRAVESKDTFIYSVPFANEQDDINNMQVTVSYAIFAESKKHSVPVAVAGYRFRHWDLNVLFTTFTPECHANEIACYLLDNNAYIVASEINSDSGKFFGEVEGSIMSMMVQENIYQRIPVLDYQAVCFREEEPEPNRAPFSIMPGQHLFQLAHWILGTIFWLLTQTSLWLGSIYQATPVNMVPWENLKVNCTIPEPCVNQVDLYRLINDTFPNSDYFDIISCETEGSKPFAVQRLAHSNLILVVVNVLCMRESDAEYSIIHNEVQYLQSMSCVKSQNENMTRQQPRPCVGANQKEPGNMKCGCSNKFQFSTLMLLMKLKKKVRVRESAQVVEIPRTSEPYKATLSDEEGLFEETQKRNIRIPPWVIYTCIIVSVAVIIPTVVYLTVFTDNPNFQSDAWSCALKVEYRVPCAKGVDVNETFCTRNGCCWNNTDKACYHSLPSQHGYSVNNWLGNNTARDQLCSSHLDLTFRGKTSPYGSKVIRQLVAMAVPISQTHMRLIMYNISEGEPTLPNRVDLNSTSFQVFVYGPHYFSVEFTRRENETSKLFSTSRGPLITSDNYWEMALQFPTDNKVFGLGGLELTSKPKVLYNNGNRIGANPFIMILSPNGEAHGVLFNNSGPMEFELLADSNLLIVRSLSTLNWDLSVFAGPSPKDVMYQLTSARRPIVPPKWALGLHVCRETVNNTPEYVKQFIDGALGLELPYESDCVQETLLGDLNFKILEPMDTTVDAIRKAGKKLLISLRPQIDISFVDNISNFVQDESGVSLEVNDYRNITVAFPDFFSNEARTWLQKNLETISSLDILGGYVLQDDWPAVNNTQDNVTEIMDYLPDGALSNGTLWWLARHGKIPHYLLHNEYGLQFASSLGVSSDQMVLSTSTYTGSGAVGGSHAHVRAQVNCTWDNMATALNVALGLGLSGIPLAGGGPVCGNVGEYNNELCLRWYLMSSMLPLMRVSSTLPLRDPVNVESFNVTIASAVRQRYALISYFYSLFLEASRTGVPVARPMFFEFPFDNNTWGRYDHFMVGSALLVRPMFLPNQVSVQVYLPKVDIPWYHLLGGHKVNNGTGGYEIAVPSMPTEIVTLIRGGCIIPLQEKVDLTVEGTLDSNYTLVVALNCSQDGSCYAFGDLNLEKYILNFTSNETDLVVESACLVEDAPSLQNVTVYGLNGTEDGTAEVTVTSDCGDFRSTSTLEGQDEVLKIENIGLGLCCGHLFIHWTLN